MIFLKWIFPVTPELHPVHLAQKAVPYQPQPVCTAHALGLAHHSPSWATCAASSSDPLFPQGPVQVGPPQGSFLSSSTPSLSTTELSLMWPPKGPGRAFVKHGETNLSPGTCPSWPSCWQGPHMKLVWLRTACPSFCPAPTHQKQGQKWTEHRSRGWKARSSWILPSDKSLTPLNLSFLSVRGVPTSQVIDSGEVVVQVGRSSP